MSIWKIVDKTVCVCVCVGFVDITISADLLNECRYFLQIILEASFASGSAAAVAIDRVYVENGRCSNGNSFRTLSH